MKKLTGQERDWVLYDVGNSAFVMLTATALPIYFKNIAEGMGIYMEQETAPFFARKVPHFFHRSYSIMIFNI